MFESQGGAFGEPMSDVEHVRGGSAWGAGTFAGRKKLHSNALLMS